VDELEKLKRLLRHWMEHNNEHVQLYRDWAEKTPPLGNQELTEILRRLSNETEKLNRLFEEAIKIIG